MSLTIQEIYEDLFFPNDCCHPEADELDLQQVTARVVSKMPENVQQWLLYDTSHCFVVGSRDLGQFFMFSMRPDEAEHVNDKICFVKVRVIFLAEHLKREPLPEAEFTIAHEIAHSRLGHLQGSYQNEVAADDLAVEWGFLEPAYRKETREGWRRMETSDFPRPLAAALGVSCDKFKDCVPDAAAPEAPSAVDAKAVGRPKKASREAAGSNVAETAADALQAKAGPAKGKGKRGKKA